MVGISHARAYIIWHRYRDEGEAAFLLRSSRPHQSPRRTAARVERRIERARRRRRWGPLRLQWLLGIARSTIYAVLCRLGLSHRRVFRIPLPPARRYERALPGELLHVDTKKLGRLLPGGGKRFGPWRTGRGGAGWDYLHVAVDDRSRVPYVERLLGDDVVSCARVLERALHYFSDLGVRVRQVMTDNAMSYRRGELFQAVLARHGVAHLRTPAYTPRAGTARLRPSSGSCCASGPTPGPTWTTALARSRSRPSCITTLTAVPTASSEGSRRCNDSSRTSTTSVGTTTRGRVGQWALHA